MGFCVNIDLMGIKNNSFSKEMKRKKLLTSLPDCSICGKIKKYWRSITFWTYPTPIHPTPLCDSRPKFQHLFIPIYQNHETHSKRNIYKSTNQTYLEAGKPQQLPSPPPLSFYKCCQSLPPTILHCHWLFFSTLFLAKHPIVFI